MRNHGNNSPAGNVAVDGHVLARLANATTFRTAHCKRGPPTHSWSTTKHIRTHDTDRAPKNIAVACFIPRNSLTKGRVRLPPKPSLAMETRTVPVERRALRCFQPLGFIPTRSRGALLFAGKRAGVNTPKRPTVNAFRPGMAAASPSAPILLRALGHEKWARVAGPTLAWVYAADGSRPQSKSVGSSISRTCRTRFGQIRWGETEKS